MNEIDLGRLLPLVVLWIIWMLITRRRGKNQAEVPEVPPAEKSRIDEEWEEPEGLDAHPVEYEPAGVYHRPVPPSFLRPSEKECRRPRQIPELRAMSPAAPRAAGVSRKELRRLVVWSEILAPPLGIRDKGSE